MNPLRVHLLPVENSSLGLKLFFLENLGSNFPEQRLKLRQELKTLLELNQIPVPLDILDLGTRPNLPQLNVSLSHNNHHSAIAWTPKTCQVGVDIEDLARSQLPIIERVSSPRELKEAPDVNYLWSAKEAVIKALPHAFKVMSSVEIINWNCVSADLWTFAVAAKSATLGYGEFRLIMNHSLAFFTSPS